MNVLRLFSNLKYYIFKLHISKNLSIILFAKLLNLMRRCIHFKKLFLETKLLSQCRNSYVLIRAILKLYWCDSFFYLIQATSVQVNFDLFRGANTIS